MKIARTAKNRIKPEWLPIIRKDEKLVLDIAMVLIVSHKHVKHVLLRTNDPLLVLSKPALRLMAKKLGITVEELTEERPQEVENVPA